MEKEFNYVYLTTNILNEKQYVGSHSTNNVDDDYLGSGRYFLKALKKEGKENFKREILQECNNILEARELEGIYIEKHNTLYPNGYNLSPKGGMGFNGSLSEDHKKRISEWQLGKTYEELYGKEKANIMKQKQKNKKQGSKRKPTSIKTKEKQSKWQKGRTYEYLYGPEKAAKMKEKQSKRKLGTTTKRKGKGFKQEFIEKYGEEEGIKRYEEFIKKQSESHKK